MTKNAKKYRKFIGTSISMALVTTAVTPAYAAHSDVGGQYTDAVNHLVNNKITKGITNTTFGTHHTIKRVDAAIMLAKALELNVSEGERSGFTDVPLRAEPYVAALKKAGYIKGKTATSFDPHSELQRGEAAMMLSNAFGLEGSMNQFPFTDVADRYVESVERFLTNGITVGKSPTRFGTSDSIIRGEYAVFLYKLLQTDELKEPREKLEQVISKAEDLLEDANLTEDDRKTLEEAIADAKKVVTNQNATQEELEKSIDDLNEAIDDANENIDSGNSGGGGGGGGGGGTPSIGDTTNLKALIGDAKNLADQLNQADAKTALDDAIAEAEKIADKNRPTKSEVKKAEEALQDAINKAKDALEAEKPANNTDVLEKALEQAKTLTEDDYTTESWTGLQTAITEGEAVLNKEQPTQEEVDSALTNLHKAIQNLVLKSEDGEEVTVNKSALDAAIEAAGELKEENYTDASWSTFAEVLEKANVVSQNENANQEAVDEALKALQDSIEGLELKSDQETAEVNKNALNAAIEEAETLLADDNKGKYTAKSFENAVDELVEAQKVNSNDDATQGGVDQALKDLQDAIENLELAQGEDGEDPAVNTDALEAAIQTAESLKDNEDDYTADTWNALATELNEAIDVRDNSEATQDDVNTAVKDLHAAIQGLDLVTEETPEATVNKDALISAIETAEALKEDDYTAGTWATLQTELDSAIALNGNSEAKQEEVNQAVKDLHAAIQGLELAETDTETPSEDVDKSGLGTAIKTAEKLEEDVFTAGSWKELQEALKEAEDIHADKNAEQPAVDKAIKDLHDALENLVAIDKLQNSIDQATNLLENTEIGSEEGQVSEAAHNALEEARDAAEAVLKKDNPTKKEVADAKTALDDAIAEFNDAIVGEGGGSGSDLETGALEEAIEEAKGLLDDLEGDDKTALDEAIQKAEDVLGNAKNEDTEVTQDEIDNALDDLKDAINNAKDIIGGEDGGSGSDLETGALEDAIGKADELVENSSLDGQDKTDLQEAIKEAQDVVNDAKDEEKEKEVTQDDINNALNNLNEAIDKAENVIEDANELQAAKDSLNERIEEATDLERNTEEGSGNGEASKEDKDTFKEAIQQAETSRDASDATTDSLADAENKLKEAIDNFKNQIIKDDTSADENDKSNLATKITEAEELLEKIEVGGYNNQVSQKAAGDLQSSIERAEGILGEDDLTKGEVDFEIAELEQAINDFNSSIVKDGIDKPTTDYLEGLITEANRLAEQLEDENDKATLQSAIDAAQQVVENVDANDGRTSQEDVKAAEKALQEEMDAADDIINPPIDITELEGLIDEANDLLDKHKEGTDAGNVRPSIHKPLVDGLEEAKGLLETDYTAEQITDKIVALQSLVDQFKDAIISEEEVALQKATEAVEKAEESKIQGDIDTARGLVNDLRNEVNEEDESTIEKLDQLQERLDDIEADLGAYEDAREAIEDAETAVGGEGEPTKENAQELIDKAKDLVSKLPTDAEWEKEEQPEMVAELEKLQEQYDEKRAAEDLEAATKAVGEAESAVEETAKKEQAYNDANEDQKEEARDAYIKAQEAEIEKVDNAKQLVEALPESDDKEALQERLNAIKVDYAEKYVKRAEESITQAAINTAERYVNKLSDEWKDEDGESYQEKFNDRLTVVEANLEKINEARSAVEELEDQYSEDKVDPARAAVENIINIDDTRKALAESFSDRIDNVVIKHLKEDLKSKIDDAEEARKDVQVSEDGNDILVTEQWVTGAVADALNKAIDAADKVYKLEVQEGAEGEDGEEDQEEVTAELLIGQVENAITNLDDAIGNYNPTDGKLTLEQAAENDVQAVEDSYDEENQTHAQDLYDKADELVDSLDEDNDDLRDRLDKVNAIIQAEQAVKTLEEAVEANEDITYTSVNQAQDLIDEIDANHHAKGALQERLTKIEEKLPEYHGLDDLAEAIEEAKVYQDDGITYEENSYNRLEKALQDGEVFIINIMKMMIYQKMH